MITPEYLLGYDVGSSSVKVTLLNAATGKPVASATCPQTEMPIDSPQPGWAEQAPEMWWENAQTATRQVLSEVSASKDSVLAIGISYQMHGLVIVDRNHNVLRPSIIWCDSRAVPVGDAAFEKLGASYCLEHLLNSPGNFTASKLRWVRENERDVYKRIHKFMLPGDYIAMRLTGEVRTTVSGLSEGVFWDFKTDNISEQLLRHYEIDRDLIPEIVPTFGVQGHLTNEAASALGLKAGIPVTYRAGDQPNNAFSLKTLEPGEIAATAGTSGVVYGIIDTPSSDPESRVNTFVHVNHSESARRYGVLLCVNGTGIMNSWLRRNLAGGGDGLSYEKMNQMAASVPVGSDNVFVLPFGNGAERMLRNREPGASFHGLNLNRHGAPHLCRAVQEGIVFSLAYGFDILNKMGLKSTVVRAGKANMFLSDVFSDAFVNTTGTQVELFNTDGSQGAARAAGVGCGYYSSMNTAFDGLTCLKRIEPDPKKGEAYREAFEKWKTILNTQLTNQS
ncbi:MAG: FGGY family carbohydrate kinase [Bacteroidota bacterium]|nr:MAG: carbohydrate kinase [Bacteroidota bacterium]